MKQHADLFIGELETLRTKVKTTIVSLYRQNVRDYKGDVLPDVYLTEEWEWEGQPFNALSQEGLVYKVNEEIVEQFCWNDMDTESLIEVVRILEDKEFD